MLKKLSLLLLTLCLSLFAACSATMPGENFDEAQQALCSGPPVATGMVGNVVGPNTITTFAPWAGPPAEAYSAMVSTTAPTSGKISWGSTSGVTFRTTGCVGFDGPCAAWPSTPNTALRIFNGTNADGTLFASLYFNGVKAAELAGVNATTSLQNTKFYSGGLTRIRQDTGANSRLYFEGWNAGAWTSWPAKFFNACGSIN